MKKVLIVLILCVFTVISNAHEEPSKNKKDKQNRDYERMKIQKKRIKGVTVWLHDFKETNKEKRKVKFYTEEYDERGNKVKILQYDKNGENIEKKVVYQYDSLNNLIGEISYDIHGNIVSREDFKLDSAGCVYEVYSYKNNDSLTNWCQYVKNYSKKTITFYKYDNLNNLEYKIIYYYNIDLENEEPVILEKKDVSDKILMIVRNVYNQAGQRIKKIISDENDKELYHFEYIYNGSLLKQIEKVKDDKKESIQTYNYDHAEYLNEIITIDNMGKPIKKLTFEYFYY